MQPEWLPPLLTFPGNNVSKDYEILYDVYRRDFIESAPALIEGSVILVDTSPDPYSANYTRGFTHMITRGDSARGIDYARAEKLPWVRAVLENYRQPEVHAFWHTSAEGDNLYLWLPDYDFVIILRPFKSRRERAKKIIVTAHSVDPNARYKLQRRFGDAKRILE